MTFSDSKIVSPPNHNNNITLKQTIKQTIKHHLKQSSKINYLGVTLDNIIKILNPIQVN